MPESSTTTEIESVIQVTAASSINTIASTPTAKHMDKNHLSIYIQTSVTHFILIAYGMENGVGVC